MVLLTVRARMAYLLKPRLDLIFHACVIIIIIISSALTFKNRS